MERYRPIARVGNRQEENSCAVVTVKMVPHPAGEWVKLSDVPDAQDPTYQNLYQGEIKKVEQRDTQIRECRDEILRLQREVNASHERSFSLSVQIEQWKENYHRACKAFAELDGWSYDMKAAPRGVELIELGCGAYLAIVQWSVTHKCWIYAGSGITRDGVVTLGKPISTRVPYAWRRVKIPPHPDPEAYL